MIFLSVGNWHKGFDRLVKAMDELIETGGVHEKVVMQIGKGKYRPQRADWFEYCSPAQCEEYIEQCRIVIAHAGMGTIATAIRYGKPVIVVPRRAELGEHYDNHQFNTARQLVQERRILLASDVWEIPERLEDAKTFIPAGTETSSELISAVESYLARLQAAKG